MSHKLCLVRKVRLIIYGLVIIKECCHMPTTFYNLAWTLKSQRLCCWHHNGIMDVYSIMWMRQWVIAGARVCVCLGTRCILGRQDSLLLFFWWFLLTASWVHWSGACCALWEQRSWSFAELLVMAFVSAQKLNSFKTCLTDVHFLPDTKRVRVLSEGLSSQWYYFSDFALRFRWESAAEMSNKWQPFQTKICTALLPPSALKKLRHPKAKHTQT